MTRAPQVVVIGDGRASRPTAILAEQIGLDIPHFKPWVRKLKALGLTESLRPGYRLSPRGAAGA